MAGVSNVEVYYINHGKCKKLSFSGLTYNLMAAAPLGVLMGDNNIDHFVECMGDLAYDLTGDMLVGLPCHIINYVFDMRLRLGFCTEPIETYFMQFMK